MPETVQKTNILPVEKRAETDQQEYDRKEAEKDVQRKEGLRRTAGGDPVV
jgi:hypothetical protein